MAKDEKKGDGSQQSEEVVVQEPKKLKAQDIAQIIGLKENHVFVISRLYPDTTKTQEEWLELLKDKHIDYLPEHLK